ncbi:DUF3900 domain-containing protein [Bacillus sp. 1P06AnD]|uniref:DUF3900 domain-containing protein n=1 Tax=Bacillus sp. 1P06AnD TaxID=3132208 RepID=UPI0039A34D93
MDFDIIYLSFYVIQDEGDEGSKKAKHFQTMESEEYLQSPLNEFLGGELKKIAKRKVEKHPKAENVPTKLGYFIVQEGFDATSNPNFVLFNKTCFSETKEQFHEHAEQFVQLYMDTSSVRGGAFIILTAKLNKYFDEPFLFLLKCDFEPKVASISDERTLIRNVEMAITTKNMKSIMYPHMPEEGMVEENELKIHQSSHAKYFEDFLKFVDYNEPMPEIMKAQVMEMVSEQIMESLEDESEEMKAFEQEMEVWSVSDKREIKEQLDTHQIVEAAASLVEITPDLELRMKLDHVGLNGMLSDFGDTIHMAKLNGKYVTIIESDSIVFEKNASPIEFLKPDELDVVIERIKGRNPVE